MKTAAKIISVIFHPMLLATYAVILMFALPGFLSLYPYNYKKVVILVTFILTFVMPLLILLVLLNMQKIKTLNIKNRKEREQPFLIIFILYLSGYFITLNFPGGIPVFITTYILCSAISVLIIFIINLRFKISVHSAGAGGFTGFFLIFFLKVKMPYTLFSIYDIKITEFAFFSLLFLLSGIIISARLYLKAHNPYQTIAGFFVGLISGTASIFFY